MRSEIDITPEQYHAGLDKLWDALGVSGPQNIDVFSLVALKLNTIREFAKKNDFVPFYKSDDYLYGYSDCAQAILEILDAS